MSAALRRTSWGVLALFALLLLNAQWVQVVRADDLREDPRNTRALFARYDVERGPVVAGDAVLAESVDTGDTDGFRYDREYPRGGLFAHVTGYYSLLFGATGVERALDDVLSGQDSSLVLRRLPDLLTGGSSVGGSVRLTLDPRAQAAAASGLGDQPGAVVALDPRTGAVLALVSSPTYDPDPLSATDVGVATRAKERLDADPEEPLLNRAVAQRYPPGSTFKVVVAAAALASGQVTPGTVLAAPDELDLPGTTATIANSGGASCGDGRTTTLSDALRTSCNTAFGQLALDLGADRLREQARAFGFGDAPDFLLPPATSVYPSDLDAPQTAQTGIGQFDVSATPLQMALVAAGVANDGVVMDPYLVAEVLAPDLSVLSTASPTVASRALEAADADALTEMMVEVVDSGTGTAAQVGGVDVAGKTGTAEQGGDRPPHAWFVGFAPADDPQVAVAVLVEDGGDDGQAASGGRTAAPIARDVLRALLEDGS